jgi:hypothetical protein
MELPTFSLSFKRRKILDKIRYNATGEREWIKSKRNLGQAFRRVSDRYADQIFLIQDEKELTPIVRLSNNVNQLANNTVKVIYALVSLNET